MLWDYTLEYLALLDQRRRARLDAAQTPEQLADLQLRVRESTLRMWGGLPPEKTALNPRHEGTLDRPGYQIEKIIFGKRKTGQPQ